MIGLVPFVSIPAIIEGFGKETWVMIAIAQTIGQIFATFVELSWASTGLSRVLITGNRNAFLSCIRQKTSVFAVLSTLSLVIYFVIGGINHQSFFVLSALIYSMSLGLSNNWAWLGKDENEKYVRLEAFPRIFFGISLLPLLYTGHLLLGSIYFALLITVNWVTSLVPIKLFSKFSKTYEVNSLLTELKYGVSRLVQTVYFASLLPLFSFLGGSNIFEIAMYDRIYRLTQSLLNPLSQFLASRLTIKGSKLRQRMFSAIILGLLFILFFSVMCLSSISNILFKQSVSFSLVFLLYLGLGLLVRGNTFFAFLYMSQRDINDTYLKLGLYSSLSYIILAFPLYKLFDFEGLLFAAIIAEGLFIIGLYFLSRSQ